MRQQGSILLVVLLTLSALIILCSKQSFFSSLMVDTVLAKEAQEKKFWLLQGLLECSTMLCKNHWPEIEQCVREKKKLSLIVPQWPPGGEHRAEIKIMQAAENKFLVQVHLYKEQSNLGGQSCLLSTQTVTKNFKISDWTGNA
jgi:hypothetical protein